MFSMQANIASTNPLYYSRLIGKIDEKSANEVVKDIDQYNNNENKKLFILTICSMGGLLYFAQTIHDSIKASKKPIICIASGTCMSAAVMIIQAAQKRVTRSNTVFMLHHSSYFREEKTCLLYTSPSPRD